MKKEEQIPKDLKTELSNLINKFGLMNIDEHDIEAIFGESEEIGVGMTERRGEESLENATLSALTVALGKIGRNVPLKVFVFFAGNMELIEMSEAVGGIYGKFENEPEVIFGYDFRENVESPVKIIVFAL